MFHFYWTLLHRVPRLLLDATGRTKSIAAILVFILAISNQEWANRMSGHLSGISPWWSAAPVILIILYGMMRAIYESDKENRLALETAEAIIAKLEKQLNKQEAQQRLKDNLGSLLASGNLLLGSVARDNDEFERQVNNWIEEVKTYLSSAEYAIFMDNSGINRREWYNPGANNIQHMLSYRLQRLREYIERLS